MVKIPLPSIAVLIPCKDEALTIGDVIIDFKRELPNAIIYVYDNLSTDNTFQVALDAGAIARKESLAGKGNVVRRMFADIDADIYILVDGDSTYDATAVKEMVDALIQNDADMIVGTRVSQSADSYRNCHQFGNKLFTGIIAFLFGKTFTDIFSGYRVLSKRFVKSFPAHSKGFETETELTVHALQLRLACHEVSTLYKSRPEGSFSKLNTWKDGYRIACSIFKLVLTERPLYLLGLCSAIIALCAFFLILPVLTVYFTEGLVPRLPSLIAGSGLGILAIIFLFFGYLFDRDTLSLRETRRLFYLQQPSLKSSLTARVASHEDTK